ncbi:MAG TPA: PaaI family thioesterase [Caulobacteraceae bacterium]|nr:PaaI family thioesterase [Caulobacteraceae bacterium]
MTDAILDAAELGREMMRRTPQSAALGFEYVAAPEPDVGAMKAPFRDDLVGDPVGQVIAGGVITTLLDHTCGLAISLALRAQEAPGAEAAARMGAMATLDFRIDYMRPARPRSDVIGRAHCYRITRSVAFVRAVAFEDDPADPIATAQAAFAINRAGAGA